MNEVHFITYMTFHCFRLSLMLETTLHNPLASGTVGGGALEIILGRCCCWVQILLYYF